MGRKRKKYEDMSLDEKLRELRFQTKEDFKKLREKEYAVGKSRKRKIKSENARKRDAKIRKKQRRWQDD